LYDINLIKAYGRGPYENKIKQIEDDLKKFNLSEEPVGVVEKFQVLIPYLTSVLFKFANEPEIVLQSDTQLTAAQQILRNLNINHQKDLANYIADIATKIVSIRYQTAILKKEELLDNKEIDKMEQQLQEEAEKIYPITDAEIVDIQLEALVEDEYALEDEVYLEQNAVSDAKFDHENEVNPDDPLSDNDGSEGEKIYNLHIDEEGNTEKIEEIDEDDIEEDDEVHTKNDDDDDDDLDDLKINEKNNTKMKLDEEGNTEKIEEDDGEEDDDEEDNGEELDNVDGEKMPNYNFNEEAKSLKFMQEMLKDMRLLDGNLTAVEEKKN